MKVLVAWHASLKVAARFAVLADVAGLLARPSLCLHRHQHRFGPGGALALAVPASNA